MAILMAGGPVADEVFAEVRARIAALADRGVQPGLATILVGDDLASAGYIRMKQARAGELGMASPHVHLPATATQGELINAIDQFNRDPTAHAILVQHPTPAQIDYERAILTLDANKDVDGLHPSNLGRLAAGLPCPVACTPAGIEALLAHYGVPIAGREVVILGRGTTIGRPLSILLSLKRPTANAAVTLLHSGVTDWPTFTARADVVVSAAGVPGILTAAHVKPGAVVVGAGVRYRGRTLLPDVSDDVEEVASMITPRVGGVGPTTVAMLFRNAVGCAEQMVATFRR